MPRLLTGSFRYKITNTETGSNQRLKIVKTLVLENLLRWKYTDKLNEIVKIDVTIAKNSVDSSEIYFERNCHLPGLNFEGVITGIKDVEDNKLVITVQHEAWHFTRRLFKIEDDFKEYELNCNEGQDFKKIIEDIVTSANADMPFDWKVGPDTVSSGAYSFSVKWKNYYDVFKLIAKHSEFDLWAEGREINIGKKGTTITVDVSDKLYEKLTADFNLDTYGNIINVIGARSPDAYSASSSLTTTEGGAVTGVSTTITKTEGKNLYGHDDIEHELLYNYERVVSNNNFKTQDSVNDASHRLLKEFYNSNSDVKIDITHDMVDKYDMRSGDIIRIVNNTATQTVRGYYRIMQIRINNRSATIKVQFSRSGKFLTRLFDSEEVLESSLVKIQDIELNS